MTFSLPIDGEANRLLERSPLALLTGMLLDQQVPMEKAFSSPYVLAQRLGHDPDARELADYDPQALVAVFTGPPALHRFPKAMAGRVQELCRILVDRYDGDAGRLWADVTDGRELLRRIVDLPGFGTQKAQILVALLGKRYGVRPDGWREAAGGYGDPDAYRSVADVTDAESLRRVREYKQQAKAAAKAG
ncbi:HhH-GPD-type base excision DNA repair protein [Micromonospora sp. NBC_00421]|uniref:HhH-GPD-type base excision DNA repair protein n=1 Tax=Micromonospora sp. NBC_00421 TaxID=2975976 RepID=UPI002E1BDE3B